MNSVNKTPTSTFHTFYNNVTIYYILNHTGSNYSGQVKRKYMTNHNEFNNIKNKFPKYCNIKKNQNKNIKVKDMTHFQRKR